jgi:hypothetical protein
LKPLERWKKYEDPLVAALHKGGLGEVTGGGAMFGKDGTIGFAASMSWSTIPPEGHRSHPRRHARSGGSEGKSD